MYKKILAFFLTCIIVILCIGCEDEKRIIINVEDGVELSETVAGKDSLIEIGSGLYYDSSTRIVYWWNGNMYRNNAIAPSAYYARNGLPYRYNPETKTLEEIDCFEINEMEK